MKKINNTSAVFSAVLASSMAMAAATSTANPFTAATLDTGYMKVASAEGKCGEGKCGGDSKKDGEGKCGEGKCGGDKKKTGEGKCGEGKCGGDKKKTGEGKCGEGKCGGKG